jgi:hypothetical protein
MWAVSKCKIRHGKVRRIKWGIQKELNVF